MEESKMVREGQLADPIKVAEDGYRALMSGDDMVISGMKNQLQVGMSNVMPDSTVASRMHHQQEPTHSEDKK
jgi:short-subunit dehydrogenase